MIQKKYILGALLIGIVLIGLLLINTSVDPPISEELPELPEESAQSSLPLSPEEGDTAITGALTLEDSFSKGKEDAPVVVIEYGDYQCSFCSEFYHKVEKQFIEEYVYTGKVKFIYKDFPLQSIHPQAIPAALAARCAGEQGKFWEYHNSLYENGPEMLGRQSYEGLAMAFKFDMNQFTDCLYGNKYLDAIRADLKEGVANGVKGTPAFLVGKGGEWRLIKGIQSLNALKFVIDPLLE